MAAQAWLALYLKSYYRRLSLLLLHMIVYFNIINFFPDCNLLKDNWTLFQKIFPRPNIILKVQNATNVHRPELVTYRKSWTITVHWFLYGKTFPFPVVRFTCCSALIRYSCFPEQFVGSLVAGSYMYIGFAPTNEFRNITNTTPKIHDFHLHVVAVKLFCTSKRNYWLNKL